MKAFRKPIALLVALLMAIIPFCGFAEAGPVRTELDDALNVPGGTLSFSDGGTEYPMQAVTVDERVCAKTTNQTGGYCVCHPVAKVSSKQINGHCPPEIRAQYCALG